MRQRKNKRQNEVIKMYKQLIMQVSDRRWHGGFLLWVAVAHKEDLQC